MLHELVLAAAIVLSAAADVRPVRSDLRFQVIVNRSNPVSSLTRAELSAIFTRRVRRWPDGADIVPVDQSATSPMREHFSRSVHGKSVAFVIRYWHRLIFAGRAVPPREAKSDAEVLELVSANRGAIGYVDAGMALGGDVKAIGMK